MPHESEPSVILETITLHPEAVAAYGISKDKYQEALNLNYFPSSPVLKQLRQTYPHIPDDHNLYFFTPLYINLLQKERSFADQIRSGFPGRSTVEILEDIGDINSLKTSLRYARDAALKDATQTYLGENVSYDITNTLFAHFLPDFYQKMLVRYPEASRQLLLDDINKDLDPNSAIAQRFQKNFRAFIQAILEPGIVLFFDKRVLHPPFSPYPGREDESEFYIVAPPTHPLTPDDVIQAIHLPNLPIPLDLSNGQSKLNPLFS